MWAAATGSTATNITSSPMCLTTRPPDPETTSCAVISKVSIISASSSPVMFRVNGVNPTRSTKPTERRYAEGPSSYALDARWRWIASSTWPRNNPSMTLGISISAAVALSVALARVTWSLPPRSIGSSTETRNNEMAASAMPASAAPITRVNRRVGSSPKSCAPSANRRNVSSSASR